MPLHLLGKKSWNVYNADNIARVRRDEAAAKAAEEAEEQRMQEIDAQRRLAILRGEVPPPIEDDEPPKDEEPPVRDRDALQRTSMRRKRKRPGEDDTDFEMRLARENDNSALVRIESEKKSTSSAPIVDHNGHIDLLGDEKSRTHAEKNEEAEREAKKKKQSYEDQYTMRFSNATGKDGVLKPWYSQSDAAAPDASSKDVWGNQDPNRKERDAKRIVSNDPLAMMKKGASKVREIKQERKRVESDIGVANVVRKGLPVVTSGDTDQEKEDIAIVVMRIHKVEDMSVRIEKGHGARASAMRRVNNEKRDIGEMTSLIRETRDLQRGLVMNDDDTIRKANSLA
ncbi:hypothetical protein FOC1_g10009738 [Fusarium oxysporum f. sp. cubense race 1]|uniref:CBF1-interacting co-repressor CIR N-terminal domain-containing protein n=1 Tax=Fusarium oxysporum f. sp. cubense (strain race 1) TaxID=1229664 RepID=N4UNW5_FUSC1|nr:hypothetical protein FOC1_g10009738 [Fusarium oxysporum f. sp. cubense race 1]